MYNTDSSLRMKRKYDKFYKAKMMRIHVGNKYCNV